MTRVLIVGGGMLGTAHALEALARGWEVIQFEASAEPRASTPRSPGVLAFSRCAPGLELSLGLASARSWRELAARMRCDLIRELGSLVAATDEHQAAALRALSERDDAPARGWRWIDGDTAREAGAPLDERVVAVLGSDVDLVVEARALLAQIRTHLHADEHHTYRGGIEVRDVGGDSLTDTTGRTHHGDLVVLCPGARSDLTVSVLRQPSLLRPMRVQLAQTARFEAKLPGPLSDLSALGASGVGRSAAISGGAPDPRLGSIQVGLTCVQRRNGALTVGEARQQDEPFGFDIPQRPTDVMMDRLSSILGPPAPPVARQWAGTVRNCTDGRLWLREDLDETVTLVTGAGQRGIMLAPAIAADTFDWLADGTDSAATHPGADGGRVG